jgi:hypothetical protein
MGKAKLGLLLAGAYAFGLVLLVAVGLSLPKGTLCMGLHRVPDIGHRAVQLARVAVHAGALGLRHLPAALEPQGLNPHRHSVRFCTREASYGCVRSVLPGPTGVIAPFAPLLLRVVLLKDG